MITAHINEHGIVLRFGFAENFSTQEWETLLDELKSHYIPSFYPYGKRLHVDIGGDPPKARAVIYLTDKTVTMDEAIRILKQHNVEVFDVRTDASAQ